MFCTTCSSPYTSPYQTLHNPNAVGGSLTAQPCPLPPPPPAAQPVTSGCIPPNNTLHYRNVNNLPLEGIYGAQGPNANIVCGQRPLVSLTEQSLFNEPPPCASTQSQVAENVENYDTYTSQLSVLNPYTRRPLPLLSALLAPSNIELIKNTIGCMLSKQFGFEIGIADTPAFRQTINDVALDNPRWMYDVQNGLPLLNQVIINREYITHQSAIRQQLLYEKFFIRNDRQKFMPYAVSDHVIKGETVNDPSSYQLNQPVPISYECFLAQAGLGCKR